MKWVSALALSAALSLFGCASPAGSVRPPCLPGDGRDWQKIEVPENADELRRLADATAYVPSAGWTEEEESWFRLPTGEIMLCRSRPLEREWWFFRQTADGPELIGHDGIDI